MLRHLTHLIPLALLASGCLPPGGAQLAGTTGTLELTHCSLGCSSGTCSVNTIATNEDIILTFNRDVDPTSVTLTSIRIIEETTGLTPFVQFLVDGPEVIIRPVLIETGVGVTFGFVDRGQYRIQLVAEPESHVVRGLGGVGNRSELNCVIRTEGVSDPVPGPPIVTVTPSDGTQVSTQEFDIVCEFNDLMNKSQLVNPETGEGSGIKVYLDIEGLADPAPVLGTWEVLYDQEALTTTASFTSLTPYPGTTIEQARSVLVEFEPGLSDLANQRLANPQPVTIHLPSVTASPGAFSESFADTDQLDPSRSVNGLWSPPAIPALDSGIDFASGTNHGGGSGVLGLLAPAVDVVFDTDGMTFDPTTSPSEWRDSTGAVIYEPDESWSTLDGQPFTVAPGEPFQFAAIAIPDGVTIRTKGSHPLRLLARGKAEVKGGISIAGASGADAYGKYFEGPKIVVSEPFPPEEQGDGSAGALGALTGGDGGRGGDSYFRVSTANGDLWTYYDNGNYATGPLLAARVQGRSGQGVGGLAPLGHPVFDDPGSEFWLEAAEIANDRAAGSGLGSLAWPLFPNQDSLGNLMQSRWLFGTGGAAIYEQHALHRARGGGGGGYWTAGQAGVEYTNGQIEPDVNGDGVTQILAPPKNDPSHKNTEYNTTFGADFALEFDLDPLTVQSVPDAAGGLALPYDPGDPDPWISDWISLDPLSGYLRGGSGGGGGGSSGCGSYSDGVGGAGVIDYWRSSSGLGGGAGGGAMQLQAGDGIEILGSILATGGNGASSLDWLFGAVPPGNTNWSWMFGEPGVAGGGAGSGGAVLLQTAGSIQLGHSRSIVLSGGIGGIDSSGFPRGGGIGSQANNGGDGGSGILRVETETGSESYTFLSLGVTPPEAVDLAPTSPTIDAANVAAFTARNDRIAGTFSPDQTGVQSSWYEPDLSVMFLTLTDWSIELEYSDGIGSPSVLRYDSDPATPETIPTPGVDPIMFALESTWGLPPSAGLKSVPREELRSGWVLLDATNNGLDTVNTGFMRLIRFQIVFDTEQIEALVSSSDPNAYFRVKSVHFSLLGE